MNTAVTVRPGLDVNVREAGTGDPIVILHGAAGPNSIAGLVDHLASRHRVIAPTHPPTHPGFSDTTRPADLDSVPHLARLHLDLIDRLNLTATTLIGVSFGGWVAAEMTAADDQHRITRLALIDAVGPHIPGHQVRLPTGPSTGSGTPGGPPPGPNPLTAYTGPEMQDPTLLDRVRRRDLPALLIWGDNDQIISPDFGHAYADALPQGRFVLIPGGGHLPMREQPKQTYTALDLFLTEKS